MKTFKQDIQLLSYNDLENTCHAYSRSLYGDNYYNGYDVIGVFNHKNTKPTVDYVLFDITESDIELIQNVKLKDGQFIFRYETEKGKIFGMKPLIKIDLNTEMVYFLKDYESEKIIFESKGSKIRYMKALDIKFNK